MAEQDLLCLDNTFELLSPALVCVCLSLTTLAATEVIFNAQTKVLYMYTYICVAFLYLFNS